MEAGEEGDKNRKKKKREATPKLCQAWERAGMVHPGWLCLLQGSLLLLARARQSRYPASSCPLRGKVSADAGGLCCPPRRSAVAARASSGGAAAASRELRGPGGTARLSVSLVVRWRERGVHGVAVAAAQPELPWMWGAELGRRTSGAGWAGGRGARKRGGEGRGGWFLGAVRQVGADGGAWCRRKIPGWAQPSACAMRDELRRLQPVRLAWSALLPAYLAGGSLLRNAESGGVSSAQQMAVPLKWKHGYELSFARPLTSSAWLQWPEAAWADLAPVGDKCS